MRELLHRLRRTRWATLCIVNLRILIGFAFLPAALKKILDQPFTDPANTGRFHDFLHAFHATGWFYTFVGVCQLVAAVLLCTQRFALLGAIVAFPVLTAITAFCWSTGVDLARWAWCGLAIIALYVGVCLAHGGIYRPRGMDLGNPAFYVLPTIAMLPLVTLALDLRARRHRA